MSLIDDLVRIRKSISDINLRLNSIRASAGGHNILSSVHGDTLADAVQDGDIIYGNGTPAWARRARKNNGDLLTLVGGYPDWVAPAAINVTEADIQFYDEFADASRHWAWLDQGTTVGRTITESGSVLTIATDGGTISDWWTAVNSCQKALIGFAGFPCEIITKLNSYPVNNQTEAGIAIARNPGVANPAADSAIFIGRFRDDGAGQSGYCVQNLGSSVFVYAAVTTLPVWFRIRVGLDASAGASFKADFSYSTDGVTYTILYTSTASPAGGGGGYPIIAALHVRNWTGNSISAPFEFFKMIRSKGPG
jgi:hypothetical protein